MDVSGHYIKCEPENVRCGSLQCQQGSRQPEISGIDHLRIMISTQGMEYECKSTSGKTDGSDTPGMGLVRDGTSCGDNLVCINQTCTSLFPLIGKEQCPSNHNNNECSSNGVCTNTNKCYCNPGWTGPDCSIQSMVPTHPATTARTGTPGKNISYLKPEKIETPYENTNNNTLSTGLMVLILVFVVKGVFICFALMAVCYRRKSTVQKYEQPYAKKPPQKNYTSVSKDQHPEHAVLDNIHSRILNFNYGRNDTQRVLFQAPNNVATTDGPRLKDHKSQVRRLEEEGGAGGEEAVSFIDMPQNKLMPEKSILKKHHVYDSGTVVNGRSVEHTLDHLNGYHENIIEALRQAHTLRELSSTPGGVDYLVNDEASPKTMTDCSYPNACHKDMDGQDHSDNQGDDEEEEKRTGNVLRIRNLEDLIKQLERHSARQMSPCGSEEIRISESEADRLAYRKDSSVCSESSQGSRRCSRTRDDAYCRCRQPSSLNPYGTQEDVIYETADHDRVNRPDSESDAFIQAQQQLVRWTSEDGVQHRPPQQPPPPPPPLPPPAMAGGEEQHQLPVEQQLPIQQRGYYPSPPHTTDNNGLENDETENAQSHQQQTLLPDVRGIDVNHLPNINKRPLDDTFSLDCNINNGSPKELNTNNTSDNENTALLPPTHFPEYKH
ncbi:Disintegrin and metalloproteinase domain-containing protein 11 [Dufourea novaeangliae]|uniref:Disintegrin and metalloproteinase domain-containing protein 11 n=1 Tax=Dufourea novaeangliae TaxID=178035 RepID=A0A154PCR2_DUFNO|nr:Disintegrin and metalloproteinase domain-containing protein 11 [Dufourea novaeangliae]